VLPTRACAAIYVSQLHRQPWVQGNYSHIIVQLSSVYSKLRGDESGIRNDDSAQARGGEAARGLGVARWLRGAV